MGKNVDNYISEKIRKAEKSFIKEGSDQIKHTIDDIDEAAYMANRANEVLKKGVKNLYKTIENIRKGEEVELIDVIHRFTKSDVQEVNILSQAGEKGSLTIKFIVKTSLYEDDFEKLLEGNAKVIAMNSIREGTMFTVAFRK